MISIGDKIGRWEILRDGERYYAPSGYSAARFVCRCSCGKERLVRESTLLSGESKSCGCLAAENATIRNKTHGMSSHKLYNVWKDMTRRCTDPSRKDYKHYGGRGIEVHSECCGETGIIAFIKDMESTHVEGLELERVNVNGNYNPNNCTWVTRQIQVINRRPMNSVFDTHFLTFKGKTLCISQWGAETGINSHIISDRVGKLKWSVEKALTVKPRPKRIWVICKGTKFVLSEVITNPSSFYKQARLLGLSVQQYIADILQTTSVSIEVNKKKYSIAPLANRDSLINSIKFNKEFLKVFNDH